MTDKEIAALAEWLRVLSTKQPDYGMSYHARGHGLLGNAEIHLFGKRAEAAHWLMENAPTLITSLTTPSDRASQRPLAEGATNNGAAPLSEAERAVVLAKYATPAVSDRASGQGDGWRPIETAPKDGTKFLGGSYAVAEAGEAAKWHEAVMWWDEHHHSDGWDDEADDVKYVGAWMAGKVGSFVYEEYAEECPTYWRPLPTPPSDVVPGEQERGE